MDTNIRLGTTQDLEAVFASYCNQFPENERKDFQQLNDLLMTDAYNLLILQGAQGRMGYAFVYAAQGQKTLWLDYIVIEPEFQGQGLGSTFFKHILEFWPGYKAIFLELEIPTGQDKNQERRLTFYYRFGAKHIPIDYQLPTMDGGFPMLLLYAPISADTLTNKEITATIKSVFDEIHSDIPCKDEVYRQVATSLK